MLIHWIWFAERKLPDRLKYSLLERYGSAEAIYNEDPVCFLALGAGKDSLQVLADKSLAGAQNILEKCDENHIAVLSLADAEYPDRLRNIYDPPIVLYCKGKLPEIDNEVAIGIVGTRDASLYGLTVAKKLGYQVAAGGGLVVSGMARGNDCAAMEGALLAGRPVIGVLGTGADVCYPKRCSHVYEGTIRYGCIVSEYPPGTGADGWHFPRRNRIISGLCCGTVVVESPENGGGLITAAHAREQGRDVFAVPGNVDVAACVGSNRLLRDGAIAVSCGWDILSEYTMAYPGRLSESSAQMPPPDCPKKPENPQASAPKKEKKSARVDSANKKTIDKPTTTAYIDPASVLGKLTEAEQQAVRPLLNGERLVDDVIAESGISAGRMLALLTVLEIKGIISRLPGKRICLKDR